MGLNNYLQLGSKPYIWSFKPQGNDVMGRNGGGGTDSTGNVEAEQDVKPDENVRGGEDGGSGGSGS